MKNVFFIVGPTASGKSEIAADVAVELEAEIISADAFQIYDGLDLLTAKPDAATLAKAPHHLLGALSLAEEMNAEKFRQMALAKIDNIRARGKRALVVGGSGLYIKALTSGLSILPGADPKLRAQLNELSLDQLREKLLDLDPEAANKIDIKNRRRVVRAIEIASVIPSEIEGSRRERRKVTSPDSSTPVAAATSAQNDERGVFVFRERDELYTRINRRVEVMFANGVVDVVAAAVSGGRIGATASQALGLREIRELIAGKISIQNCIEKIQQGTRRYAKRQLTWFRHQTNFEPLNLSLLTHHEAVKWISQMARRSFAQGND